MVVRGATGGPLLHPLRDDGGHCVLVFVAHAQRQSYNALLFGQLLCLGMQHEVTPPAGVALHLDRAPDELVGAHAEELRRGLLCSASGHEPFGSQAWLTVALVNFAVGIDALQISAAVTAHCICDVSGANKISPNEYRRFQHAFVPRDAAPRPVVAIDQTVGASCERDG